MAAITLAANLGSFLFLVLVARAPATVWNVQRSAAGVLRNLEKKKAYVNHYSFHLMDPVWGHVVIKMSGQPPFGAQIILNGQNVGRYFVATAAGKHVPPQRRYYLPEPWLRTDGPNELLIFDEHGNSPDRCRLVHADSAYAE